MPFYTGIDEHTVEGKRTLERLLAIRAALRREVPRRTHSDTLLLATWNIRDFDKPAFGSRLDESIYYIAEIISHFDIIAVQEVYRDLRGLERVMAVLGGQWRYVITDATEGGQGNDERMAFVFDTRKVSFGGLAGELVLPPIKQPDGSRAPASQWWRTPYICGFRAGWAKFMLATVHITWGADTPAPQDRVNEIAQVADFLRARTEDPKAWSKSLILLGDFNIFSPSDVTFEQLSKAGFTVPPQLQVLPSNANKVRHYDQIAFRVQPGRLDQTGAAGVFDYYQTLFRAPEDEPLYRDAMQPGFDTKADGKPRSEASKKGYFKTYWRTHQMSDHLPMWVELNIDNSDAYLRERLDSAP